MIHRATFLPILLVALLPSQAAVGTAAASATVETLPSTPRTLAVAAGDADSSTNNFQINKQKDQIIASLPLIPHHVQRRRLKSLGLELPGKDRHLHRGQSRHRRLHDDEEEGGGEGGGEGEGGADNTDTVENNGTNEGGGGNAAGSSSGGDSSKMQIAHLFQGYGTHYADLWCGKPNPQRQTVIVDTGSGVTAFPCVGCDPTNCGVPKYHLDALFDMSLSTTYRQLACNECVRGHCSGGQCGISMSYQEGSSWSAFEVQDECYVGGLHDVALNQDNAGKDDLDPFHAPAFSFTLDFGCQNHLTGLFITQLADGIMGMDNAGYSFWAQMCKKLSMNRQFSLCFSRSPTAEREGTNAGAMTLGGTDKRLHDTDMVYTPISQGAGFYNTVIRQIFLREGGGESAAYNPNVKVVPILTSPTTAIVDSGTTDTYFSRSMKNTFDSAWKDMVGESYSHNPINLTPEQLKSRPTILFQLKGDVDLNKALADSKTGNVVGLAGELDPQNPYDVILAIPASHYYEYDEEDGMYTARFYDDEGGGNVIGANAMMGHDVFFDVDANRLGWSESNCDYPALVQPFVDNGQLVPTTLAPVENARQEPKEDEHEEPKEEVNSNNPHDSEKPQNDVVPSSSGTCSSTCQVGIVAAVVAVVVAAVWFRRRSSRLSPYSMANLELELGTVPSEDSDEFANVRYRDRRQQDETEVAAGVMS